MFSRIVRSILPSIYQLILNQSNEFSTRLLSSIARYDKKTLDDYMREIFLPNNIVRIKSFSSSINPTIYELTEYGSILVQSDEIFVKN